MNQKNQQVVDDALKNSASLVNGRIINLIYTQQVPDKILDCHRNN